jgi:hypothetical protein
MGWRWVWLRAQLTGIAVSAMVWLVWAALAPLSAAGLVLLGVLVVAGWSSRPVLWWRYGARRLPAAEAETMWQALVPLEWLRGRSQPRLWVGSRLGADVFAAAPRQLIISERLAAQVGDHRVSDHELCWLTARAFGLVEVNRSRLVGAVSVFCAPWALLEIIAGTLTGPVASLGLVRFAWRIRWLFLALAGIDLYGRGHWPGLIMLALVAVATLTTPRWNRAWAARQAAMTDQAGRLADGSTITDGIDHRLAGRPAPRPVPRRGGVR